MEEETKKHGEIIIVKRGHDDHDDHHGGVWKIAFADFMTAMMAFFLVMWLINSSNEQTRKAVASYFNPVKLMDTTTNPKGIKSPKYGVEQTEEAEDEDSTTVNSTPKASSAAPAATPLYDEKALFVDPYALLSEIEGGINQEADNNMGGNAESDQKKRNGIGLEGGASFQDPFDPAVWNIREGSNKPNDDSMDEPNLREQLQGSLDAEEIAPLPKQDQEMSEPNAGKGSEDAEMSGKEEAQSGEEKLGEDVSPEHLELISKLQEQVEKLKELLANSQLNLEIVPSDTGVSVVLSDKSQNGMFSIGSARPTKDMVIAMKEIGKAVSEHTGMVEISGHTDGRQYQSTEYDNWRLSSARAQMAYYMLQRGGMDKSKVDKIIGQADMRLKVPEDPLSPANRRIEVLLRVE